MAIKSLGRANFDGKAGAQQTNVFMVGLRDLGFYVNTIGIPMGTNRDPLQTY